MIMGQNDNGSNNSILHKCVSPIRALYADCVLFAYAIFQSADGRTC